MYTFRLSRSLNYALPIYITEGDSPSLALRIAHMPDIGWTPTPLDRTRAALGPVPHWQMVNALQQFKAQCAADRVCLRQPQFQRSEEHTSELQSLMRMSNAVFCLKKKTIMTNSE